MDGNTVLCSAIQVNANGNLAVPTCIVSTLAAGTHTITAIYSGDVNNAAASTSMTQTVTPTLATSSITLTSSSNPSTQNQSVVFKTVIAGSSPTGSVMYNGDSGPLCSSVPVREVNGTYLAYCVATFSDSAMHSIAAAYSGDAFNAPSSSAVLSQSVTAATAFNPNQFGLTGSWYNAATSGQGLLIEVAPDLVRIGTGVLFAGWFTYDTSASGAQRWYTLQGTVDSTSATAILGIYQATGGNFSAPPKLGVTSVGSATLVFGDCTHSTLHYTFTDGSARTGTIPLTRLSTPTACAASGDNGVTGTDFFLSGAWYNAATSGQGIVFEVSPPLTTLFGAWYTYAQNGQSVGGGASQRWFTIQTNSYVPGARSAQNVPIYAATGGVFDDPVTITNSQVGTANITFTSCSAMSLAYTFTGGEFAGQTGSIAMTPVGPVPKGCQ